MATIRASIGAVPISEVCLFGILDNIKKIQTPKKKKLRFTLGIGTTGL